MKYIKNLALIAYTISFGINVSLAADTHWTHDPIDQADWGAIEDTSQTTIPLNFPYAECAIGIHQSPIDLAGKVDALQSNNLTAQYPKDKPDFFNTGHAPQVNVSTGYKGKLKIGNDSYPLVQYHLHAPSEHVIGNQTFDAELHFVHVRADGKMAVLGVLLKVGNTNTTLNTILNNQLIAGTHNAATGITIYPKSLLPSDINHYYTYAGSLTTPPCSEGVNWYVLSTPVEISSDQLTALKDINMANEGFDYNNRKPQSINSRIVSGRK